MNNEILKNAADKLEPEAKAVGEIVDAPKRAIFLSIAISLKRIADKMDKSILSKQAIEDMKKER